MFETFDVNNNGSLERKELHRLLQHQLDMTEEEADYMLNRFDDDKNSKAFELFHESPYQPKDDFSCRKD